jgi:isoquinoline 1-oxidoreductase beta subunit
MMHMDVVYAAVETGPVRGAEPETYEEASVRSMPGVSDVVRLPYGVAVVANSFAAALAARPRLKVTWRSDPAAADYDSDDVLEDFARIAADSQGHPGVRAYSQGDAGATLAALAQHSTETLEIRSQLVYHATMEPQNATARVAADGKSVEVWVSTQWPTVEKQGIAKAINLAPESVTLHMPYVIGGGFGRRSEPGAAIDAVQIAKHTGKTVKVIWTREDDLRRNPHRQALVCRIEAAVSPQGRILATRHRVVADSWFARFLPDFFAQANQTDPGNWSGCVYAYDVPLQLVDNVTARRAVDVCYMRGIGVAQTQFGLESLIDRIASQHRQDPLAYRISMLRHDPRAVKTLEAAAEMADWSRPRAGRALGIAYTNYTNSHAVAVAEVSVNRETGEIRVHNVWSAIDAGLAMQPAIVASQTEGGIIQGLSIALFEQVTVRKGVTQESNFDSYRMLRMSEAPEVTVKVLSTDNAPTGVGEVGIIPIASAVNNAVACIIGKHLTGLPMRPDDVLHVIRS